MTDPRGNSGLYAGDFTIIYEYDDLNRLVAGYLPMSPGETEKPVVRLVYDARGNLLERVEPDGGRTKYEYTPRNWVKTTTVQGGGKTYVTRHYYDKAGNEIRIVDPRGYETRREYDALRRLTDIFYPDGSREWFEYDENGNCIVYANGRAYRTEYAYDRYNRLVETRDANGGITRYFYDRWGNMTRMVNPLGHVFRYDYDELDRLIQETDSLGYVKKYRYDAVGNRIYSKDPNGTESIYEYYPNNLVKKIFMQNGTETKTLEYWYDEAGYKRRVRDDGVELFYNTFAGKYIPDPFGRIRRETRIIDGRSFTVDYTYDVMGRVTGIKYPSGQEVTYQYNSLGELTGMPGYLSGAPTYDQGGLLTGLTAANGIAMTRAYDQNARLQNLGYKDPQAALKEYQYTYDGANNIIQRNNDQFQYDALNQLVFARLEGSFEIGPENDDQRQGRTLEDYYGTKQLEFTTLPEILELDYAAGSIGVDLRGEFPVTRVELTPASPVHRVKPRNLVLYISNDNSSYTEVKDWEAATGAGGEIVITFATPVAARFIKIQCQFDDRDRAFEPVNRAEFKHKPEELIKVYYTITSRYEEYAYDAVGNRVQERITLRMTETRNYSYYPNSSRLLTNGVYGYLYDANGNLIRKGTSYTVTGGGIELKEEGEYWEYRYDLLNRLTEVKKNGSIVARYWYDETGLRVKKESGNGTIYYVFNLEGQVLYEEENQGYVEYIYLLGRHFARVDGYRTTTTEKRTTYFYHTDHLGSTVLVTDENGATVWSTEYTPFGSLTFEEGKLKRAVKFTGKDLDEDTGLYYFNARWYDQSIGRFISEDPIKDGLNWYIYCKNNPLKFIDLSGLAPTLAEAAEIAAHVYRIDEEAMKDELPGGWKRIEYYNRDTLQMGVYSREKEDGTMEYVVSNAGTREILDWAQNIKQPFGSSEDMINSIKYATYFVEKYSDSEITFVGHSKGGAEAAGNALATNKNAILFNPASINAYAYDLDVSKYTADMTAYIVKGEILNNIFGLISRPIDKMVYLPTQYSVNTPIEELNLVNSVRNHSMSAVKEAIKEWEEPKEKKWGPKWW